MSANKNCLAADTINGVYNCEIPTDQAYFVDMAFYEYLIQVQDGETVYGIVSDDIAEKIAQEYGIR